MICIDEEHVIRQPTYRKDRYNRDEHANHLPFALHRFDLSFDVLSDGPTAPQHSSHENIANQHNHHWDTVGEYQDKDIIAGVAS